MQTETRNCQNCKNDFRIEPEDFVFYEKMQVPPPTWCPECREIRRSCWRNERALYKRKCDLCGDVVVSRVSPDKKYKMYCKKCWWSDKWDQHANGRDFDFSRPFFDQFHELLLATPHISLLSSNTVNSDWVNQETDDKNCYLNVGGHHNEDSGYCTYELNGNNCYDCYFVLDLSFCYEMVNSERCHKCFFSRECFDCYNLVYSSDCRNCSDLVGCTGLRNKQYCIFNKQYSKDDYERWISEHHFSSRKVLRQIEAEAERVRLSLPHRFAIVLQSNNSTGHFITHSNNCRNCWNVDNSEDSKNCYIAAGVKDFYDCTAFGNGEMCYEISSSGGMAQSRCSVFCLSQDSMKKKTSLENNYCYAALSSSYCFGCANLKNANYCILNKQYSKEEYGILLMKIIEHMRKTGEYGEYFPPSISPFGYNETTAMEWYPTTKEKALAAKFVWCDYERSVADFHEYYEVPDSIVDVDDSVLDKVLVCEASGKPYKIILQELLFYRSVGLPLPLRSPAQRHQDRIARLMPRRLYSRDCQKCHMGIQTPYAPERPEIVYCEKCYQKEVM